MMKDYVNTELYTNKLKMKNVPTFLYCTILCIVYLLHLIQDLYRVGGGPINIHNLRYKKD